MRGPGVGVVVGNPKPGSRTLAVADAVATAAADAAGLDGAVRVTFDLAELGPELGHDLVKRKTHR